MFFYVNCGPLNCVIVNTGVFVDIGICVGLDVYIRVQFCVYSKCTYMLGVYIICFI